MSSLQRHTDRGCTRPTAGLAASNHRQSSITDYLSVHASVKSNLTEKCVEFCCRDIKLFHSVTGKGVLQLARDVINVGATQGRIYLIPQQSRGDVKKPFYNTVLNHALDSAELRVRAPEVTHTLQAAKALLRYVKQTGIITQLSATVMQMSETRFCTMFITLDSINHVYTDLCEKLESCKLMKYLHMSWSFG